MIQGYDTRILRVVFTEKTNIISTSTIDTDVIQPRKPAIKDITMLDSTVQLIVK